MTDLGRAAGSSPAEAFPVAARDGVRLVCESHAAGSRPRAHVLVVHGFAEHRGRYRKLTGELVTAGYAVHLFDLRGHGESGGRRGHVDRFDDYLDDLACVATAVLPEARQEGSGAPAVLLGHSLGGLIALAAVRAAPGAFRNLVLSSPFLAPAFWLPPFAGGLAATAARLVPSLDLPAGLDPAGLSRDPEVVRAYRQDPRVLHRLTASWLRAILAAQDEVLRRCGEVRLPVLLLAGGADPIADPHRSREVFERLGSTTKRLQVYDGFLHEVLNELGRERVVADLLDWLELSAPPGEAVSAAPATVRPAP